MRPRSIVCLYVCVVEGHFIGSIIRCYWNPDVAWLGHTWRETFQAQRCESSHQRTSVSAISCVCVCVCSVCHSCEIASAVAMFRKPSHYDVSSLIFFVFYCRCDCVYNTYLVLLEWSVTFLILLLE